VAVLDINSWKKFEKGAIEYYSQNILG